MVRPNKMVLCAALVLASGLFSAHARATRALGNAQVVADMHTIKGHLVDDLLAGVGQNELRRARQHMQSLNADGSWADVDYSGESTTSWRTVQHLHRLLLMAKAYRKGDPAQRREPKLKASCLSAFDLWTERDFQNRNWWWNQIGVPRVLGRVMLLIEDALSETQMERGLNILRRAELGMTGQNLIWVAEITIVRGCLAGEPDVVASAFGRIADEIRITPEEGIQADLSFHQHGAQLYSGGYGKGFSTDCSRLAALAGGTGFAFSSEKIDILSRYILDGQQWMVCGRTFDYGAMGREVARKGTSAAGLMTACRYMARLNTPRRDEFAAFAESLTDDRHADGRLSGSRHFWRSDFMAHQRQGYYTSVKMASVRTKATEAINGEGLKSYHIGDGMTLIFRRGDEYDGIFPVWDWRRLPGVTCEQSHGALGDPTGVRGATSFVGGASDGTYGMAAYDLVKDNVRARKAWFHFDREFVCLGAGITCPGGDPVFTSINQCHLRGDVTASDGNTQTAVPRGQRVVEHPLWVHHDDVGYVFPWSGKSRVHLRNDAQTGSWSEINRQYSTDEVSHDVFSLWLDHGAKPENATYAYVVAPGMLLTDIVAYADNMPIQILSNRPDLQAVWHKGLRRAGIAFYSAGSVRVRGGLTVTVSAPCLMLLAEEGDAMQIALSNPENEPLSVEVDITRKLAGEGCVWLADQDVSRVTVTLPDEQYAGQSVVRRLEVP